MRLCRAFYIVTHYQIKYLERERRTIELFLRYLVCCRSQSDPSPPSNDNHKHTNNTLSFTMVHRRWILLLSLLALSADAFVPVKPSSSSSSSSVGRHAFWRHWIPETDLLGIPNTNNVEEESHQQILENAKTMFLGSIMAAVLLLTPQVTVAVAGGGLDYANIDITGRDFSNGNYKGKDFTQVIAKGTNFANSNLQGCRFYKAYLVRID